MAITLEQAAVAGDLAAKIKARQEKIAQIENALAAGWVVGKFVVVSPDESELSLILDRLDVPTSQQCLQFALSVYQTQLNKLETQLAAIAA